MACCDTPIPFDTECPRMPMYGGFSIAADGVGFKMPCRWCGEVIAASILDEPLDLENGFSELDSSVIVSHLYKYHQNLFKGKTFFQECEKCHNRAT